MQPEIEEWSSWDEDAPTSIKIEGGNGNVSPPANEDDEEPDYFKDMAPTIRKTQKVHADSGVDPCLLYWELFSFQMVGFGCRQLWSYILNKGNKCICCL